jgi:histidine ammonia-lyase
VLDGTSLTCGQVAAAARGQAHVEVSSAGLERARRAATIAAEVTADRAVYGRTTGVGANRSERLGPGDADASGLRLLRSHASGGGPPVAPELGLAMLIVRANQIAVGGSGVHPGVLPVLAECVNRRLSPPVPAFGAIGTGDLTALASAALCLLGEREWVSADPASPSRSSGPAAAVPAEQARPAQAGPPSFVLAGRDAIGFLSSNAATLGEAALACHDLATLLRATLPVAALSQLATGASTEPYAKAVQAARPHPGQRAVADALRRMLGDSARLARPPARVQDPYGYRALPQVLGAAVDAARHADRVITAELNSASENPLIGTTSRAVWHNGNFHGGYVCLALDSLRAAVFQAAGLSVARLAMLAEPSYTGLRPFLADGPAPSSGIMMLEYTAHSAMAELRLRAGPAALGGAVLSRGAEDHASFATQSARETTAASAALRTVLACELVAATRALRMQGKAGRAGLAVEAGTEAGSRLPDGPLTRAFRLAAEALPAQTDDRPLDGDLAAAETVLPELAAVHGLAGLAAPA